MLPILLRSVSATKQIVHDPCDFSEKLIAFLRGLYYIVYFRTFRQNVKIGFPFSAFASVKIIGPGSVSIGKNCYAAKNVFKGWNIVTHCPDSSVKIGDRCVLGGITIRCKKYIEIGDKTMSAISLIQDSFFVDQNKTDSLVANGVLSPSKPVIIKENVWLGAGCTVISGSYIARDSVLSAGVGCYDSQVDEYCLVIGNPAKKPLSIERLLKLKGNS